MAKLLRSPLGNVIRIRIGEIHCAIPEKPGKKWVQLFRIDNTKIFLRNRFLEALISKKRDLIKYGQLNRNQKLKILTPDQPSFLATWLYVKFYIKNFVGRKFMVIKESNPKFFAIKNNKRIKRIFHKKGTKIVTELSEGPSQKLDITKENTFPGKSLPTKKICVKHYAKGNEDLGKEEKPTPKEFTLGPLKKEKEAKTEKKIVNVDGSNNNSAQMLVESKLDKYSKKLTAAADEYVLKMEKPSGRNFSLNNFMKKYKFFNIVTKKGSGKEFFSNYKPSRELKVTKVNSFYEKTLPEMDVFVKLFIKDNKNVYKKANQSIKTFSMNCLKGEKGAETNKKPYKVNISNDGLFRKLKVTKGNRFSENTLFTTNVSMKPISKEKQNLGEKTKQSTKNYILDYSSNKKDTDIKKPLGKVNISRRLNKNLEVTKENQFSVKTWPMIKRLFKRYTNEKQYLKKKIKQPNRKFSFNRFRIEMKSANTEESREVNISNKKSSHYLKVAQGNSGKDIGEKTQLPQEIIQLLPKHIERYNAKNHSNKKSNKKVAGTKKQPGEVNMSYKKPNQKLEVANDHQSSEITWPVIKRFFKRYNNENQYLSKNLSKHENGHVRKNVHPFEMNEVLQKTKKISLNKTPEDYKTKFYNSGQIYSKNKGDTYDEWRSCKTKKSIKNIESVSEEEKDHYRSMKETIKEDSFILQDFPCNKQQYQSKREEKSSKDDPDMNKNNIYKKENIPCTVKTYRYHGHEQVIDLYLMGNNESIIKKSCPGKWKKKSIKENPCELQADSCKKQQYPPRGYSGMNKNNINKKENIPCTVKPYRYHSYKKKKSQHEKVTDPYLMGINESFIKKSYPGKWKKKSIKENPCELQADSCKKQQYPPRGDSGMNKNNIYKKENIPCTVKPYRYHSYKKKKSQHEKVTDPYLLAINESFNIKSGPCKWEKESIKENPCELQADSCTEQQYPCEGMGSIEEKYPELIKKNTNKSSCKRKSYPLQTCKNKENQVEKEAEPCMKFDTPCMENVDPYTLKEPIHNEEVPFTEPKESYERESNKIREYLNENLDDACKWNEISKNKDEHFEQLEEPRQWKETGDSYTEPEDLSKSIKKKSDSYGKKVITFDTLQINDACQKILPNKKDKKPSNQKEVLKEGKIISGISCNKKDTSSKVDRCSCIESQTISEVTYKKENNLRKKKTNHYQEINRCEQESSFPCEKEGSLCTNKDAYEVSFSGEKTLDLEESSGEKKSFYNISFPDEQTEILSKKKINPCNKIFERCEKNEEMTKNWKMNDFSKTGEHPSKEVYHTKRAGTGSMMITDCASHKKIPSTMNVESSKAFIEPNNMITSCTESKEGTHNKVDKRSCVDCQTISVLSCNKENANFIKK